MVDIQKIRRALLHAFDIEEGQERNSRGDALDTILAQYFNKASHMPRELTLEAIVNLLKDGPADVEEAHHRVRDILDQYH